jgi:cytochrome c oxidase accessory protein FixG
VRRVLKYAVYLVIAVVLANTFIAYFVGTDNLRQWVTRSPLEHPAPFLVMVVFTGLMIFDFAYFREQVCLVACPYGRFQSVMLDRDSLIVSYDPARGEPRSRGGRPLPDGSPAGDCIDCGSCNHTCPTGIDVRNGLQMECVACTQCIDACNAVMARLGKPPGLIRLSSQARIAGEKGRWIRPRVVLYPTLICVLLTAFVVVLAGKQPADVTLLRGLGMPYMEIEEGRIRNQIRVKIKNRSGADAQYQVELAGNGPATLFAAENPIPIAAGRSRTESVLLSVPREAFVDGKLDVTLRVSDGGDFEEELNYKLLGPRG